MKTNNIFDRIRYVIEKECNNKIALFSKKTGIGDQTVRNIVKYEKSYPGYEVLVKIIQTFYWLNPDWLLLGDEPIERNKKYDVQDKINTVSEPINIYKDKENRLISIIESQQRTIENLTKGGGKGVDSA